MTPLRLGFLNGTRGTVTAVDENRRRVAVQTTEGALGRRAVPRTAEEGPGRNPRSDGWVNFLLRVTAWTPAQSSSRPG